MSNSGVYIRMTLPVLRSTFAVSSLLASSLFGVLTLPLALYGNKPLDISIHGESQFEGTLKEVAPVYIGFAAIASAGVAGAGAAFVGWRRSTGKAQSSTTRLATLEQQLKEKEQQLEDAMLSENKLKSAGLDFFLGEPNAALPLLEPGVSNADELSVSATLAAQLAEATTAPSYSLETQSSDSVVRASMPNPQRHSSPELSTPEYPSYSTPGFAQPLPSRTLPSHSIPSHPPSNPTPVMPQPHVPANAWAGAGTPGLTTVAAAQYGISRPLYAQPGQIQSSQGQGFHAVQHRVSPLAMMPSAHAALGYTHGRYTAQSSAALRPGAVNSLDPQVALQQIHHLQLQVQQLMMQLEAVQQSWIQPALPQAEQAIAAARSPHPIGPVASYGAYVAAPLAQNYAQHQGQVSRTQSARPQGVRPLAPTYTVSSAEPMGRYSHASGEYDSQRQVAS